MSAFIRLFRNIRIPSFVVGIPVVFYRRFWLRVRHGGPQVQIYPASLEHDVEQRHRTERPAVQMRAREGCFGVNSTYMSSPRVSSRDNFVVAEPM